MLRPWLVAAIFFLCVGAFPSHAAPTAPATGGGAADLRLEIRTIGPGGVHRAGAWTGVLVQVEELAASPREVILRLALTDEDGDAPTFDRVVATNPGVQTFWLYGRLPFDPPDNITVAAYEAAEIQTPDPAGLGARAGRPLASDSAELRAAEPWSDAIAIVGPRSMGLGEYALSTGRSRSDSPLWHYATQVATGLSVSSLPDRWQGLAGFAALVWGETRSGFDPRELVAAPDKARAIEEWVRRGGHLVVIWPAIGTAWQGGQQGVDANPLEALLPAIEPPEKREGVSLEAFRNLLTGGEAPLPEGQILHTFSKRQEASTLDAAEIIKGPGGETLAMRREVGSGAVTIVGIELGTDAMQAAGLPEVETFWHRVLGRRGQFLTQPELAEAFPNRQPAQIGVDRRRRIIDHDLDQQIKRTGDATSGLLLAVVLFGAYWTLAGPLGFALLKAKGLERHAWMAFLGAAAVFTAIAWSGAAALSPGRTDARHVAVVEQVHGGGVQRVRAWSSVLIPKYGDVSVAIGEPDSETAGSAAFHNLLTPWAGFGTRGGAGSFPDSRAYRFDTRRPDATALPARSTVKQIRVDWAGPPRWNLPRPVGEVGDVEEPVLALTEDDRLSGILAHDLPGPLTDVSIIWVAGQRRIAGDMGGTLLSRAFNVSLRGDFVWDPNERIDLGAITRDQRPGEIGIGQRLADIGRRGIIVENFRAAAGGTLETALERRLLDAMLLSQAGPPQERIGGQPGTSAGRVSLHGWDLGRWFTRPCVIVTGMLNTPANEPGRAPAPLSVDGRAVPSYGSMLVRWIYPLPAAPPVWANDDTQEGPETDENVAAPAG